MMLAIWLCLAGCGEPPPPPPPARSEIADTLEEMTLNSAAPPEDETITAAAQARHAATLPAPPEGSSWEELYEIAGRHYEMGSWRPALVHYQMTIQLNPDCELCLSRLERLDAQIKSDRDEAFSRGISYYDSQQYNLAITAFQTVLELEPDTESTHHQRSREYLELARSKLPTGPSLQEGR